MIGSAKQRSLIADGFITLIVMLGAYSLSYHFLLDPGVSWHVIAAQRLLEGGQYLTNLFDDCTPSTFAIFIPLIWIHSLFGGSWPAIIPAYVLLLYVFLFWLCHYVLRAYYAEYFHWRSLYYALLLIILFFSLIILGQRETIVTLFMMPYLLMISAVPREECSKGLSGLIGLLAALAVSQIPIYLIVIVVIDLLFVIQRKKQFSRATEIARDRETRETVESFSSTKNSRRYFLRAHCSFYFCFVLIMGISYLLYPSYFTVVLPLTLCFESGYNSKISDLLLYSLPILILLMLQTVLLACSPKKQHCTVSLLVVGWLFLFIYYSQQKNWYYHMYPLFVLLFLLIMMNVFQKQDTAPLRKKYFFTRVLLILIFFPAFYSGMSVLFSDINQMLYFSKTRRLFDTLNQFVKEKTVLTFTTQLEPTYPFAHYTNATLITPWANIWLVPKWVNSVAPEQSICFFQVGRALFYQQTINTLTKEAPDFILLNAQKQIPYIQKENFDLLAFLKRNKKIETLLSNYEEAVALKEFRLLKRKGS